MQFRRLFLLLFFCSVFSSCYSQENEFGKTEKPSVGLAVGSTWELPKLNHEMLEIGVGYQPWEVVGNFVYYPFAGFLAMAEFSPAEKLYGTSVNAWYLSGFIAGGLGINSYFSHGNQTYGIKPMIGVSIVRIGIMYGYNFFLNRNEISGLPHQTLTIKYYYPLWKNK